MYTCVLSCTVCAYPVTWQIRDILRARKNAEKKKKKEWRLRSSSSDRRVDDNYLRRWVDRVFGTGCSEAPEKTKRMIFARSIIFAHNFRR